MSNASEILQKANINLEQRINIQKSLAAQLRELMTPPKSEPETKQNNKSESKGTGSSLINLLAGFSMQ